ncbi:MAG: Rieske 2Fe-2S domain-containing protein [Candidatus Bathyarchaeota archaeon]|jgi:nitrite reductase/ring-hydroxylating ferredoxin subunit
MGTFKVIAETEKIPRKTMKLFQIEGHEILVVNVDEEFYACENSCPHMKLSLYLGSLDGKVLTCGFHNAKFDVTTGKSLGPATKKPLKTYKVKVEDSAVLVELP